jgi:hypothetical protein
MFFNPSSELSFPVLGSRHIEDGPATPSMLFNCVSASFLIIGLSHSLLGLAKARRDDSADSYFPGSLRRVRSDPPRTPISAVKRS